MAQPRARDLGLDNYWRLPTGRHNAITDVAGVRVGHTTLISGHGPLRPGHGPVRSGVTVVLPHAGDLFRAKVRAAAHTINGFGKACGLEEVRELGQIETPIALTNTLSVWRVAETLAEDALRANPQIGVTTSSVNPVVGECNDGFLNDIQGRHVRPEDVRSALANARQGAVQEGNVGAGTGTSCFGWKGGIGTASRVTGAAEGGFTLGTLVQTNFGRGEELRFGGVPVGRRLAPPQTEGAETIAADEGDDKSGDKGSVMVVLATDAPLSARQLQRLCVRAGAGLARTGSLIDHGSGDFVIAFSTAHRIAHWPETVLTTQTVVADEAKVMHGLFAAVVEAVEEAVLNSLCAAQTMEGRDGHVRHALPLAEVAAMVASASGGAQ